MKGELRVKGLAVLLCCSPGVLVLPKVVEVLPNNGFVPKVVLPVPARPVPRPNPVFPNPMLHMEVVLELPLVGENGRVIRVKQ